MCNVPYSPSLRIDCPVCSADTNRHFLLKTFSRQATEWYRCLMCGLVFRKNLTGHLLKIPQDAGSNAPCVPYRNLANTLLRRVANWTRGRKLLDLSMTCRQFADRSRDLGWEAFYNDYNVSGPFDLLVVRHLLDYEVEPNILVRTIRKKLRSGGLLIVLGFDDTQVLNDATLFSVGAIGNLSNLWCVESLTRFFWPI
jgi:hypothetical protein